MIIWYILLLIIILMFLALVSSIRIRFSLEHAAKKLWVSYTLLGVILDLTTKQGTVTIAKIPLYRFDMKRPTRPEKKKKRKFRFKLKPSDFRVAYLEYFRSLLNKIRIDSLDLRVDGGFSDPYNTGRTCAFYWAAKGIFPRLMNHVTFNPDFDREDFDFYGRGNIALRLCHIIRFAGRILFEKLNKKIPQWYIIRRKGESYG
nr:DUF2953 domain-containing protein [candidate division Zixibacteria bacterium]